MRERWRTRFGRSMARPLSEGRHLPEPGPRGRVVLGWLGAALVVGVVAFIVGRPAGDANDAGALASTTPSAGIAGPLTIAFGTARDPISLEVTAPTSTFRRGDPFVYSVRLAEAGPALIYVRVDRTGTAPQTVQDWRDGEQRIDPTLAVISFEVPADDLLDVFGAGDYEMRISLEPDGAVLASGSFRLVEEPGAS
jgi:hypothetical protein